MGLLENKVAIITGASSGIGRAAAMLFAREGARLVLNARRPEPLAETADAIDPAGETVATVAGDVRDPAVADALVATATRRFGGLDASLNNAGQVGAPGPLAEVDEATWRQVVDVNLTAAFLGARRQIPAMIARGGGSVIFTSSFVGHTSAFPGLGPYAAAKAGLVGLARAIAAEYGPQGVRANALLPGGVDTPMGRSVAGTPEAQALVRSVHALKRQAEPEEIAEAALFLASDRSSFVTGSAMFADGGASICKV